MNDQIINTEGCLDLLLKSCFVYLTLLGAVLDLHAPAALFHLLAFLAATGALILRVVHRVFRLSFSPPLKNATKC